MAAPPRYGNQADTGTLLDVTATTVTGMTATRTAHIEPGTLSVDANVVANTNTLTITIIWQVSQDDSTYITLTPVNNAANVVLATGTGSDVAARKVFPGPESISGWKYVRAAVLCGVATGTADDTYTLTQRYVRRNPF